MIFNQPTPPCHLNNSHGQTQVSPPLRDRASSDCTTSPAGFPTKHRHPRICPSSAKSTINKNVLRPVSGLSSSSTPFVSSDCLLLHDQNCNLPQLSNRKIVKLILVHWIGSTNRFYHNQGHYSSVDDHTVVDFPRGRS